MDSTEGLSEFSNVATKNSRACSSIYAPCLPRFPLMCFPVEVLMYPRVVSAPQLKWYNVQDGLPSTMWPFGIC